MLTEEALRARLPIGGFGLPLHVLASVGSTNDVAEALETEGAAPRIKWPNDVLLGERKAAGLLVDASWEAERLVHAVLGIGVNVLAGASPPGEEVDFPATNPGA